MEHQKTCGLWITLFIAMFAVSGVLSVSILRVPRAITPKDLAETTTETPIYAFYIGIEIMNRVFNDSLLDPSSSYFKQTYTEVEQLLEGVYKNCDCSTSNSYRGAYNINFRNGSVIANATIVFETNLINAVVVKYLFVNTANSNKLGLQINTDFTLDTTTPVIAPLPTTGPVTTTPLTRTTPVSTSTPSTVTSSGTTPFSTSTPSTVTSSGTTPVSTSTPSTVTSSGTTPFSTSTPSTVTVNAATSSPDATSTSSPPSFTTNGGNSTQGDNGTTTVNPLGTSQSVNGNSTTTATAATTTNPAGSTTKDNIISEPAILPSSTTESTPKPPAPGSEGGDYVPAWAIALLVLAAVSLLLLIILLIALIVRCCCVETEPDEVVPASGIPSAPAEPLPTPVYTPQTPIKDPLFFSTTFVQPESPRRNKTGMYIVNPE